VCGELVILTEDRAAAQTAERSERAKALPMRLLFIMIAHILVTLARLTRPGGVVPHNLIRANSLVVWMDWR